MAHTTHSQCRHLVFLGSVAFALFAAAAPARAAHRARLSADLRITSRPGRSEST